MDYFLNSGLFSDFWSDCWIIFPNSDQISVFFLISAQFFWIFSRILIIFLNSGSIFWSDFWFFFDFWPDFWILLRIHFRFLDSVPYSEQIFDQICAWKREISYLNFFTSFQAYGIRTNRKFCTQIGTERKAAMSTASELIPNLRDRQVQGAVKNLIVYSLTIIAVPLASMFLLKKHFFQGTALLSLSLSHSLVLSLVAFIVASSISKSFTHSLIAGFLGYTHDDAVLYSAIGAVLLVHVVLAFWVR